jgi:hypothetical protein
MPPGFRALVQSEETALILNGKIERSSADQTQVVLVLADLQAGNFTRHPAFPIFMARLVESVRELALAPQLKTGQALQMLNADGLLAARFIPPPGAEGETQALEFRSNWPGHWPPVSDDTLQPGLYGLEVQDLSGQVHNYQVGVNAGDAGESDVRRQAWITEFQSQAAGQAQSGQGGNQEPNGDQEQRLDLMPWLLAAALLILLFEAGLAWR